MEGTSTASKIQAREPTSDTARTPSAPSRVTLRDVARLAGVSTGTVSMVLNDNPLVARDTRASVRRVLEESGYVYNRRAANLRRRHSDIVGIGIADLTNPFFAEVVAGAEAVLERRKRVVLLSNTQESQARQGSFAQTIREQDAAGLLLVPAAGTSRASLRSLIELRLPTVLLCRPVHDVELDFVGVDNFRVGEIATQHLWDLGHRRIAALGPMHGLSSARERLNGYRRVLQKHGLRLDSLPAVHCAPTREGGFAAMSALLARADRPTAAVCFTDLIAFGAMHSLRRHGVEPGRDFAVIGGDGTPESALWLPGLSTVSVRGEEIGAIGAELLLGRLAEPDAPIQRRVLPPTLVVRGSTDPAAEREPALPAPAVHR